MKRTEKIWIISKAKMKFTKNTYKYFDSAKKNKNNRDWFDKHKSLYENDVKAPLQALLLEINKKYQKQLPRIEISPDKITRPLRPKNRADDGGLIKTHTHISLAEKRTSLFEWNPGIYFQLGAGADENFFGLGLYMTSSRQVSLLRNALVEDFDRINQILTDKKLKRAWGGLKGDTYKRFPKGFNPESESAKYLKHKQFYLGRSYSRKEVLNPKFGPQLVKDLGTAIEFFTWVRGAVGTYRK